MGGCKSKAQATEPKVLPKAGEGAPGTLLGEPLAAVKRAEDEAGNAAEQAVGAAAENATAVGTSFENGAGAAVAQGAAAVQEVKGADLLVQADVTLSEARPAQLWEKAPSWPWGCCSVAEPVQTEIIVDEATS
mmetsp:Transcript_38573/g.84538  ORF Transcript_38573/g.84538 Transcript_38573/m.84538 type:complete len:133 (+) Transcript_38573:74-472(+)